MKFAKKLRSSCTVVDLDPPGALDFSATSYFLSALACSDPEALTTAFEHPEAPAFFAELLDGPVTAGKRKRVLEFAALLPSKSRVVAAVDESFDTRGMFSFAYVKDKLGVSTLKEQKDVLSLCLFHSESALRDLLEKDDLAKNEIIHSKLVTVADHFTKRQKARCRHLEINRSDLFRGSFADQLRAELRARGVTFLAGAEAAISEEEQWNEKMPDVDSELVKDCWRKVYRRLTTGAVAVTPAHSVSLAASGVAQFVVHEEKDVARRLLLARSCAHVLVHPLGSRFATERAKRFGYISMFKAPGALAAAMGVPRINLIPPPPIAAGGRRRELVQESPIAYVVSEGVAFPRELPGVFELGPCQTLEQIHERVETGRKLPKRAFVVLAGATAYRWGPLLLSEQDEATRLERRDSLARAGKGDEEEAQPAGELDENETREVERCLRSRFGNDGAAQLRSACVGAAAQLSKAGLGRKAWIMVLDSAQNAQGDARRSRMRHHRERVSARGGDAADVDHDDLDDLAENMKKFSTKAVYAYVTDAAVAQGVPRTIAAAVTSVRHGELAAAEDIRAFLQKLKEVTGDFRDPLGRVSQHARGACLDSWAPDFKKRSKLTPVEFMNKVRKCLDDCAAAGNFVKDLKDESLASEVARKLTKPGSGGCSKGGPRQSLQEWIVKMKLRGVTPGDNYLLREWVAKEKNTRKHLLEALKNRK
jgi:hypothetical protein